MVSSGSDMFASLFGSDAPPPAPPSEYQASAKIAEAKPRKEEKKRKKSDKKSSKSSKHSKKESKSKHKSKKKHHKDKIKKKGSKKKFGDSGSESDSSSSSELGSGSEGPDVDDIEAFEKKYMKEPAAATGARGGAGAAAADLGDAPPPPPGSSREVVVVSGLDARGRPIGKLTGISTEDLSMPKPEVITYDSDGDITGGLPGEPKAGIHVFRFIFMNSLFSRCLF